MGNQLEVTVNSTDQKLGFNGGLRDLAPISMDYIPPLGDGQGYMPLEMLLMSLASCSGGVIGLLLRKMNKTVAGVSVTAKGTRRDQHPLSFSTIDLEFTITSNDAGDKDVQQAIALSEQSLCPVWAMVKGNVEIKTAYRIVPV